jgi:hypothetical protein
MDPPYGSGFGSRSATLLYSLLYQSVHIFFLMEVTHIKTNLLSENLPAKGPGRQEQTSQEEISSSPRRRGREGAQSNDLTRVSSALSIIGGLHIGTRALLDINLIWVAYIARLFQWGGGGVFYSF